MSTPTMTLDQFRATMRASLDIAADCDAANFVEQGTAGLIYADSAYIEAGPEGSYLLTIFNEQYVADDDAGLAELERKLYEFLVGEGAL